jgi:hypothetical protein
MGTERSDRKTKPKREKKSTKEIRRGLRDIVRQRLASIGLEDELTWQIAARLMLLSEKELAVCTGESHRTFQGRRARGDGCRYIELSPRSIKYSVWHVLEWYDENTKTSTSE